MSTVLPFIIGGLIGSVSVSLYNLIKLTVEVNSLASLLNRLDEKVDFLSLQNNETIQATRVTDDRFIELAEKIENIDADVLDGTLCCQFVTAEIEKSIPDNGEDYIDRKIGEFDERVESLESKLETIGSAFRCLGSDLE